MSAAKPKITEAERDARKADYLFLEALNYQAQNKPDAYFALIEAAYDLNPTDLYLAKEYGMKELYESADDSLQVISGLDKIENYINSNPDDFYNALTYASLTQQLGLLDRSLSTWEKLYQRNSDRIEVGGMYADALTQTGDTANLLKAIAIYDDIDRIEGVNSTTAIRKIRIYNALKDTAAVKKEAHTLLDSSPKSVEYSTLLGNLYLQLDDRDSALYYFNRAVELDPSNGAAYYHRAQYFDAIGDSVNYDKEVFQALQLPDLDLEPKMGMLYDYVRKLYADSLQQPRIKSMFQSLIQQYPHEASVRNLYGDYLVTINELAPAAEQISYALDSDPSDAKRWQQLGSLYFIAKDYDKALSTAREGLRYHPGTVPLITMQSSALAQKKEYPEAIKVLNTAFAEVDSTDTDQLSEIETAIADIYYMSGQTDTAFVYYNKALEYNPDNALALNNCAYHLAVQDRDLDRALTMIEKVIKDDPESSTSLDTYAWVLFKRKDYAKAREIIDGALANSEDESGELYDHAGDIYFMDGQPEKAVEFWQKALKLKPDDELLQRKVKHKTFFYK